MSQSAAGVRSDGTRQTRVLEWIGALAALPERCAGAPSERDAAKLVGSWMEKLGLSEVLVESIPSRPRAGLVLALHAGIAGLGLLLGGFIGTLVAAAAALSFRYELRRRAWLLSHLLSAPQSCNVVGRVGPETPVRRVVLSAHIDAAQAGFVFTPRLANFFARGAHERRRGDRPPPGPLAVPEALMLGAALLTLVGWLGAYGFLVGAAKLVLGVGLATTTLASLQWAFSKTSPGANDNASAVAAMLTCAEQLIGQLPPDVELWLVGSGAEEVGCCGMHAFLDSKPEWSPETSFFVNFECVGGGSLHWIRSEGTLGKQGYPAQGPELARRVAASGRFGEITATDLLAGTDGHVPAERGHPTLSLISLEANGVPRNYHRADDLPEAIDTALVVRAADFGAAVALAALRGEAGPITSS